MPDLEDRIRATLAGRAESLHVSPPGRFQPTTGTSTRRRQTGRLARRIDLGGLTAAIVVAGSILIAAALVLALHGHPASHPEAGDDGGAVVPAGVPQAAHGLVARLAVLRTPQTDGDRLPPAAARQIQVQIVPSLTRRVAVIGADDLFLVVFEPGTGRSGRAAGGHAQAPGVSAELRRLGDGAELVAVPTGDPSDPRFGAVAFAGSLNVANDFSRISGGLAEIVPDGVAQARWTVSPEGDGSDRTVRTITPTVAYNVATSTSPLVRLVRFGVDDPSSAANVTVTWRAANGAVIPTLDAAIAARQRQRALTLRRAGLRAAYASRTRVAPALAAAYRLFSAHRRLGRFGSGASAFTVRALSIPQLPAQFLNIIFEGLPYDPRASIEVTGPGGVRVFFEAGDGLEVTDSLRGGGAASGSLALALQQGILDTYTAGGARWLVAVVADTNRTITLVSRHGASRVVPVINGIVVAQLDAAYTLRYRGADGRPVEGAELAP